MTHSACTAGPARKTPYGRMTLLLPREHGGEVARTKGGREVGGTRRRSPRRGWAARGSQGTPSDAELLDAGMGAAARESEGRAAGLLAASRPLSQVGHEACEELRASTCTSDASLGTA
jgi:hypothetical protein